MKFDLSNRVRNKLIESSLTTCTRWSERRLQMPPPFRGPLSFKRFPWQREILNIDEGFVTVKKAAQMGFSVAAMARALYVVAELKEDSLYVLPTAGLAGDFSKGRLDALVNLSPQLDGLFSAGNNVGLKTTKDWSNLYIRGSVAGRVLVSVPISTAFIDEFDRCADGTLDLVVERLSGQDTRKYLFNLSTPTLPEFGIDAQYQLGTQEQFFFQCPHCSKHIQLQWPDNVIIAGEYPGDPDCDKTVFICDLCKGVLPHETKQDWLAEAKWVAGRTNVTGHRSFLINQMYSTTVSPGEMASAHHKAELSDLAAVQFKNQKLAQTHIAEGARLTDPIIDACYDKSYRLGEDRPENSSRNIYLGIDVGTFLDCWIMEIKYDRSPGAFPYENSVSKVLQYIRFPAEDWNAAANLMGEWQVRYAVLDSHPDTVNARRFCKQFKGFAALCQYRRGTTGKEIKVLEDEYGIPVLTVDRTTFLDLALGRFHKGKVAIPQGFPNVARAHLKAPIRTYEMDEMNLPRGVYKSIADDHAAHACAYAEIAHLMGYTASTGRAIQPGEL